MSHRELHDEEKHREVREEVERVGEEGQERHTVREEAYGPVGEVPRDEVLHEERLEHPKLSREAGLEREEVRSSLEDPWRYAGRVLRVLGIWVGVVVAITEVLLLFRLFFLMAAANPAAGFVNFIYGSTSWMVAPFQGIAANGQLLGGGIFEWATLVGMIFYPLLGLLIVIFLRALAASPRPDYSVTRKSSRRRTY